MNRIRRPRLSRFAEQLAQDVAAAASVAAGHQASQRDGRSLAPATTTTSRRRAVTAPRLLPRTVQLCVHCRQNPAGFWVSQTGGQTVRRPWCLSCCQGVDRDRCDVVPFGS
jgi:hypothetical protein